MESTFEEALRRVTYPGFDRDIVSLGLVREVIREGTRLEVVFPAMSCGEGVKGALREGVIRELSDLPGVSGVDVRFGSLPQPGRAQGRGLPPKRSIPGVKYIIPVASGKGGVGKSTVSVNLALALANRGLKTGLLDLDIYGPSIPLMMGVDGVPDVVTEGAKMRPLLKYGIKVLSIGFFAGDQAVIWRGPMVMKAVRGFLSDVEWGELDYLVVDLPPGTGDAQLTLVQLVPITGAVIVTTPQDIALIDAKKAASMFRKTDSEVLGLVENMSYFVCPHCQGRSEIFGCGGGRRESKRLDIPFLGDIPIDPEVRAGGDEGRPVFLSDPESPVSKAFASISEAVIRRIERRCLS